MKVTTVGIDLAKNGVQVHGVDKRGKKRFNKQLQCKHVLTFFAQLPSCLIGMEACGSAHYWTSQLTKFTTALVTLVFSLSQGHKL